MTDALTLKPRTRMTWSATERAEWLALFERSGQSAAEFCRENDLSPATLSFWLRQQQAPHSAEEGSFVEVPTAAWASEPNAAVAPAVRVQLPGDVRLEIVCGTDPAWLGELLRALLAARS